MIALVVLIWLISTTSYAQGEHSRRAAAELQVLLGDARTLADLSASGNSTLMQQGLQQRIKGGLAPIDMLLRLADQEAGRPVVSYAATTRQLRQQIDRKDTDGLIKTLAELVREFPLALPQFSNLEDSLEASQQLHTQHCAACHDTPATGLQRPAYRLQQQAAAMSRTEFFARMLTGVRGDRLSGIDNPLTDAQIAGLMHFYLSTKANSQ